VALEPNQEQIGKSRGRYLQSRGHVYSEPSGELSSIDSNVMFLPFVILQITTALASSADDAIKTARDYVSVGPWPTTPICQVH
jgi:hypothetical protein